MKDKNGNERLTIFIDPITIKEVKMLALQRDTTVSELIETLIKNAIGIKPFIHK